jgi:hypothetical protein
MLHVHLGRHPRDNRAARPEIGPDLLNGRRDGRQDHRKEGRRNAHTSDPRTRRQKPSHSNKARRPKACGEETTMGEDAERRTRLPLAKLHLCRPRDPARFHPRNAPAAARILPRRRQELPGLRAHRQRPPVPAHEEDARRQLRRDSNRRQNGRVRPLHRTHRRPGL